MSEWHWTCGQIICNLTNAAAMMTGPMQVDVNRNGGRQCARLRLQGARCIAMKAVTAIDKLLLELDRLL